MQGKIYLKQSNGFAIIHRRRIREEVISTTNPIHHYGPKGLKKDKIEKTGYERLLDNEKARIKYLMMKVPY